MGLSGCYAVMKYTVFLMNVGFFLGGLAILALSAWMLLDPTFYVTFTSAQDEPSYYSGICILLLVGVLLLAVGFLGCFGAYNESQRVLVLFFCGLLLVLVAQITAGLWAFTNKDKLQNLLRYTVTNTVQYEYGKIEARTQSFDTIQREFKCCGARGPSDWATSIFQGRENGGSLKLTVRADVEVFKIPSSCCKVPADDAKCMAATKTDYSSLSSDVLFDQGCSDALLRKLQDYTNIVVVCFLCMLLVEFFGLIISLILCCAIRAVNKYK